VQSNRRSNLDQIVNASCCMMYEIVFRRRVRDEKDILR
jgi:hypothetical protein